MASVTEAHKSLLPPRARELAPPAMGCGACEKPKVNYKRGLWSPDEDQRLRDYVLKHGLSCWSKVPANAGLQRNGKSCRLRWINYLRPGLKRGNFSQEEEQTVIKLQSKLGNKWSQIAMYLPGRTDNEVKNHWNSYLKKKVIKAQKSDTPPAVSNSSSPDCPNQEEDPHQQTPPFAKYTEAVDLSQYNPFPKILFGDCLSLDQANADNGSLNLEQVMRNSLQNTSSGLQAAAGSIMNEFGGGCVFEEIQERTDEWIGQIPESALFDVFGGVIYDKMEFGTESLD